MGGVCLGFVSTAKAQETVEIEVTEFRIEDDIVYLDIGPTDPDVTNLQVQYSVTLQNWFKDLEATLTDLGMTIPHLDPWIRFIPRSKVQNSYNFK